MKQSLHNFDAGLTRWVAATFGQRSRPFFEGMTRLGDPLSVLGVSIAIIATGLYSGDMRLVLSGGMIPATVSIGALLKLLFERARPMTEYALNMKLQTFSFPSGHSTGSMITFGTVSIIALSALPAPWNYIMSGLFALLPIGVGISRVYLGAHFPSDVIAGWVLGLLSVLLVAFVIHPTI